MLHSICRFFRFIALICGGHQQLVLENLALRQQLTIWKRAAPKPPLRERDRQFWMWLSRFWSGWKSALVIVQPETVLRWQRRRFKDYWRRLSGSSQGGRNPVTTEIRNLVRRMAADNPLWGAPRIHGELLKLGFEISERTVSRLMRCGRNGNPSQNWKTFLTNHFGQMVSIDFFTVPTIRLHVLYVLVILQHDRRRIVHFNVTPHPTAAWTAQQIVEAFPEGNAPRYLIRDRDGIYGNEFRRKLEAMDIHEILTTPHSPWQNAYAERVIGSIRRECLNHVIVMGERHLRWMLRRYFDYYHHSRTHLSLEKDAPQSRTAQSAHDGNIVAIPEVGGLHHRYERRAA